MATYDVLPSIVRSSLEELSEIAKYIEGKNEDAHGPITVLIGGWAVYSYNPWYGSVDIDLITNSKIKASLTNHLTSNRKFQRVRNLDDTKRIEKNVESGKNIIIDFGNRDKEDPFEGKSIGLTYDILDGNTQKWKISEGLSISVPNRTVLLFMKTKAAWDRDHRITSGTSHDAEWEIGKLKKDRADILALLDPANGGREIDVSKLGSIIERYPFLLETIKRIGDDEDAIDLYGRMETEDAARSIDSLIDLIS